MPATAHRTVIKVDSAEPMRMSHVFKYLYTLSYTFTCACTFLTHFCKYILTRTSRLLTTISFSTLLCHPFLVKQISVSTVLLAYSFSVTGSVALIFVTQNCSIDGIYLEYV